MPSATRDKNGVLTFGKPIAPVAIEAKTADYTILPTDGGKLFTNRGDTDAITFTLPLLSSVPAGWSCDFFIVESFNFAISAEATTDHDTIVTFNDKGADSIIFSQASEIIGNAVHALSDGTGWLLHIHLAKEAVTHTVNT